MWYPSPRRSQAIAAANCQLAAAIGAIGLGAIGLGASSASAQLRPTAGGTAVTSTAPTTGLSATASPASVAGAAKQSGKSAIDAAAAIKAAFPAAPWEQIGAALLGAGYTPVEVAIGIQSAYNATLSQQLLALATRTPAEQVHALHEANKALAAKVMATTLAGSPQAMQLLAALVKEYGLTAPAAATMLREAGQNAETAAEALKQGLGASMTQVADALHAAGFSDSGLALGLVGSFNATAQDVVTNFQRLQVTPESAATTLTVTLKQSAQDAVKMMVKADYKAGQVARAIKNAMQMTQDGAIDLMKNAQMTQVAVLTGLLEGFGLDDRGAFDAMVKKGYPATGLVADLHDVAHTGGAVAAQLLAKAGVKAETAATTLVAKFAAAPIDVATALRDAKYDAPSILAALTTACQLGVAAATQLLAQIGVQV
jgi:cell division septum initiation protein DivIVA